MYSYKTFVGRRPFRRHSMENMELMKLTPDKKVGILNDNFMMKKILCS